MLKQVGCHGSFAIQVNNWLICLSLQNYRDGPKQKLQKLEFACGFLYLMVFYGLGWKNEESKLKNCGTSWISSAI
jgi:hypothetical protein